MKKNILTLGFVFALSALSIAQTKPNPIKDKHSTPATQPANSDGTAKPAITPEEKQRQDVQRAGDPANPQGGAVISTPDPRVQTPATPPDRPATIDAPAGQQPQPAANPARDQKSTAPADRPATIDAPAGQQPQPAGNPARQPQNVPPSERAATPAAKEKKPGHSDNRNGDKVNPANEKRAGTPAGEKKPKKKSPSKTVKSQSPN